MMRALRTVTWAGALLGLCASGASAESGERPFLSVFRGHASPMEGNPPCMLTNDEVATGFATLLGAVTWTSHEEVDFCGGEGQVSGEATLQGASGEVLYLVYETVATTNPELAEIRASGTYQITGGTGRFTGVTGTGLIAARGSLAPPFEFVGVLLGDIRLAR